VARFVDRLREISNSNRSLLCIGLDPDPARMPIDDIFEFNKAIVDATSDLVCAYKPNLAFFEAEGSTGIRALEETVAHIRSVNPEIVLLADGKRGDIGGTNSAYARALFKTWEFDAATVNCFAGGEALEPFFEYENRGIFVWCRSSNTGAAEFQDLRVESGESDANGNDNRTLYETIAKRASEWNGRGNVGLVVGATYPKELKSVRTLCPRMPILVPAVGIQGGDLKEAIVAGADGSGRNLLISSSRSILYASEDASTFAEEARGVAERMRDSINRTLDREGWGW